MTCVTKRLRGRRAVAQRARRLYAEPLCRDCAAAGRTTASSVPDHIMPLVLGGSDEDTNIRCLCADCHRDRTAEQLGYRKPAGVDSNGYPTDPDHPWNRN
jgi:5-methylcytosine-specific restriction protein A